MAIETNAALVQAIRQHRLLESAALEECTRLQAQFPNPKALARELVTRKWLTPYQVNQLFQGRGQELLFGSYILLERLGEGGMGQVFKARNWKMDRIVALKMIRKDKLKHPEAVRRFQREVKAAAQLHHPNIVIAYDADAVGDTHFIAMEYVEGVDLGKLVKDSGPLPVPVACELIREAALGLQHACERGLVHRDIKPTNLLVERTPAGSAGSARSMLRAAGLGHVKVLDMGLARLQTSADDDGTAMLTQDGALIGTPDFLSPEQSRNSRDADIRSDLYALGCTFYYLLTGRVPFPADTLSNKIWKQNFEEPTPIEQYRPDVPPGVVGIVRKLMAKKPEDRFQTPAALVAELDAPSERTLGGDSLSAVASLPRGGSAGAAAPTAILVSSPPRQAIAVTPSEFDSMAPTAVFVAPTLAPPPAPSLANFTTRQRLAIGGGVLFGCLLLAAVAVLGFTLRGKRKPVGAPDGSFGTPVSNAALVTEPVPIKGLVSWTAETYSPRGTLSGIAYRRDGKVLATANDLGQVRFWDTDSGKLLLLFIGPSSAIQRLAYSPDGEVLACGGEDGKINLVDPEKGKVIRTLPAGAPNNLLFWSPDSRYIVCNGPEFKVQIFEYSTGKLAQSLTGHTAAVYTAAWSPDGSKLATAGQDRSVRIWDYALGRAQHVLPGHSNYVTTMAWSPDGAVLATGGADNVIQLWETERGRAYPRPLEGHTGPIVSLAWLPDGRRLASSGDTSIRIWARGGRMLQAREKIAGTAVALRWASEPGPASAEGPAQAWEAEPKHFVRYLVASGYSILASPDGATYVQYAPHYGFHLHDIAQAKVVKTVLEHPTSWYPSAAWSPDGTMVATTTPHDASILVWNTASGELVRSLAGQRANSTVFAWSPDGRALAAAGSDFVIRLWDPVGGKSLDTFTGHKDRIYHLAWSPNGKRLASASADRTVQVWDIERGKLFSTFTHKVPAYHATWSPDGTTLATRAGEEPVVRFWRGGSEEPALTLTGHKGGVTNMAWAPDGSTFATSSYDLTCRIWNPSDGSVLRILEGHGNYPQHVAYSPNGKKLASGAYDRTVRLWEVDSGRMLDNFQGHLGPVEGVTWISSDALAVHAGRQVTTWSTATGKPLRKIDGVSACYYAADHKTLLGVYQYGYRFWDTENGRTRATLVFLRGEQSAFVSGAGHFRSIPRNLTELVYVVQTENGQQLYDAAEFSNKFRWNNAPESVRLRPK